jgi:uncharacterized membrane protein
MKIALPHARTRLAAMVTAGVVTAVAFGMGTSWVYAPIAGWDAAAAVFVGWVGIAVGPMDAQRTRSHATREDPGRGVSDVIVLAASVASLAAVGIVLARGNSAHGAEQWLLAALAVGSVGLSWFAVHTSFTLRYASLYFKDSPGGIDFNNSIPPRYLDFAYVAFTIGMTFQVSDTEISRPDIRSAVLRQALLSYLFGAVILGTAINLVVQLGH